MVICCDTSFLFSLYGRDDHSAAAGDLVSRLQQPITLTSLHEFEFENALRLAVWRKLLDEETASLRITSFHDDLERGLLTPAAENLRAMLAEARRISAARTLTGGYRSFDILLIAAAVNLRADLFLTFDARQRALAEAEGLRVEI